MPDFDIVMVGGSPQVWRDEASSSPEAPSRLVPDPVHPPTYRRVVPVDTLELRAVVGGVSGPLDAALGGRLFTWTWIEWSGIGPPAITVSPGQTSVAEVTLDGDHLGHFVLRALRDGGGAILIPFDSEEV